MITGVVNTYREAVIRLAVIGLRGQEQEVETVVDTGFNGSLTLPSALIATFGLPWRKRGRAIMADGSESIFDSYEATVIWDGVLPRISVEAADTTPLVGMTLLDGYELTVQIINGGNVVIRPLP